jgi:hypothetical protein
VEVKGSTLFRYGINKNNAKNISNLLFKFINCSQFSSADLLFGLTAQKGITRWAMSWSATPCPTTSKMAVTVKCEQEVQKVLMLLFE